MSDRILNVSLNFVHFILCDVLFVLLHHPIKSCIVQNFYLVCFIKSIVWHWLAWSFKTNDNVQWTKTKIHKINNKNIIFIIKKVKRFNCNFCFFTLQLGHSEVGFVILFLIFIKKKKLKKFNNKYNMLTKLFQFLFFWLLDLLWKKKKEKTYLRRLFQLYRIVECLRRSQLKLRHWLHRA